MIERKMDGLARYAWGVLGFTLVVILWGAYVRATGSGAGCGSHWPLCNGEVVPRAPELETIIEFTHRVTSGVALFLVIGLFLWARRRYAPGHVVRAGATLSLVFIVIEALLGAGLVLFELVADDSSALRAFSMVAHLVNTFILVGVLALTAWWASGGRAIGDDHPQAWRALLVVGVAALLIVGASGAVAALGDTLFPSDSLGAGLRDSFSRESHPLVQLRKFHPLLAILTGAYIAFVARVIARGGNTPVLGRLATVVLTLYAVQLAAGAINLILLAPVAMQLLHLLLADLLWIAFVLFAAEALGRAEAVMPVAARRYEVGGMR